MKISKINIHYIFAVIFFLITTSCENIITSVDCNECTVEEPNIAAVEILFSNFEEFDSIYFTFHHGNIESDSLIFGSYISDMIRNPSEFESIDEINNKVSILELETNQHYSVQVIYFQGGNEFHVVNGTELSTRLVEDFCYSSCYIIDNEKINAILEDF